MLLNDGASTHWRRSGDVPRPPYTQGAIIDMLSKGISLSDTKRSDERVNSQNKSTHSCLPAAILEAKLRVWQHAKHTRFDNSEPVLLDNKSLGRGILSNEKRTLESVHGSVVFIVWHNPSSSNHYSTLVIIAMPSPSLCQ
jgi:hypothetical protein